MQNIELIYDADILVYEAATSVEKTIKWADGTYTTVANIKDAQAKFRDLVVLWRNGARKAIEAAFPETNEWGLRETFAFSDPNRATAYRKQLPLVSYKAERMGMKRPVVCVDLEAWAMEEYDGVWTPSLEGDDICGMLATTRRGHELPIMVSHDKDLKQIPGHLFQPRKQELICPTPEEAERFFYYQVLCGDRVDGYFGCPGVGDVKANAILQPHRTARSWYEATLKAYQGVKPDKQWWRPATAEEAVLATARCARILRAGDYNDNGVELWTPPELN